MKVRLLFCLSFCIVLLLKAQGPLEPVTLDYHALTIPSAQTYSTSSIATFINEHYKTGREKLRAIYSWVTYNIKYDSDSMYVINHGSDPDTRITAALRRRRGVCENYAAIFNDIVNKCGIPSYEVSGYTKQYGTVDKSAHMWCTVKLEDEWYLCDPTWDAGFINYSKYFLVSPLSFIESHMPFDPLFQLLKYPVSHKEFYTGNTYSKNDRKYFNYVDSLIEYSIMSDLEKLESSEKRISQAGIPNEMARSWLSFVQMEASIIYQEKNKDTYNDAVTDLNNANNIFNRFINYRNTAFVPLKTDDDIKAMLAPLDAMIKRIIKKLDYLDSAPSNFQYDTGVLRNRVKTLANRIQEQQDFLNRYFATAVREREQLFYR